MLEASRSTGDMPSTWWRDECEVFVEERRRRAAGSWWRSAREEWVEEGWATPGGNMPSLRKRALITQGSSGMT
jgi:hypothetical protein